MAELIVKRKKQFFAPANCCFHVYIDGKKETTLSNGEKDKFAISVGSHTLQINNNYFTGSKKNIIVADGQTIAFEAYSRPVLGWLYVLAPALLLVFSVLRLFHVPIPGIVAIITLLPFCLFIALALILGITRTALVVKEMK